MGICKEFGSRLRKWWQCHKLFCHSANHKRCSYFTWSGYFGWKNILNIQNLLSSRLTSKYKIANKKDTTNFRIHPSPLSFTKKLPIDQNDITKDRTASISAFTFPFLRFSYLSKLACWYKKAHPISSNSPENTINHLPRVDKRTNIYYRWLSRYM
jgi:hypothetical protein